MEQLQNWIGKSVLSRDTIRLQPVHFMQATLDRESDLKPGDPLPPLWHWLYFLEAKRAGDLGRDAHPKKGDFLPPVDLPRRMWAGGRFQFLKPLEIGKTAEKRSTIKSITSKNGRSGPLCFVVVEHEIFQNDQLCLREEQDIVYLNDPSTTDTSKDVQYAPEGSKYSETVVPSESLLFRYSALTFNGHRIHYDADYARQVEGYDGLVFHGPLTATLLVDLDARKRGMTPDRFEFRGTAPITGMRPFHIEGVETGDTTVLWAKRGDGALAMTAKATFKE